MTQIKIEVPANDTIALNAFAEALQRIASERSVTTKVDVKAKYGELVTDYIASGQMDKELKHAEQLNDVAIDALDKELDEVEKYIEQVKDVESFEDSLERVEELHNEPTNNTLDKDGIPWDGRIHSKGKSRLTDDTWRLRKRPADKDEDEWSAYVESVKSELKAVQNAPSVESVVNEDVLQQMNKMYSDHIESLPEGTIQGEPLNEEQIREEVKEQLESGKVVVQAPTEPVTPPSAVVPPVAAVTPPTSLTPPQVREEIKEQLESGEVTINAPITAPTTESNVTTFPQLMKYITSDAAKRGATNDLVKQALVKTDPSLIAIPLIGGRIDLIPQFIKNLEELIGE